MTLTNPPADDTAEAAADAAHPALSNVRADATAVQNRIDFNDPHKSGAEAVADALNVQGLPTKTRPAHKPMITVITPPLPFVTPADIAGSHAANDPAIAAMIAAAVGEIDGPYGWLRRSIGKQTLELCTDRPAGAVRLPLPPIIGIVGVFGTDADGIETELDSGSYYRRGEAVVFRGGEPRPWRCASLRIRYTAGFSEADGTGPIPPQVKQAVIMAVQNMKALAAENLFLRSEEVEGVGKLEYTVSEAAGNIIRETTRRLLIGLKAART